MLCCFEQTFYIYSVSLLCTVKYFPFITGSVLISNINVTVLFWQIKRKILISIIQSTTRVLFCFCFLHSLSFPVGRGSAHNAVWRAGAHISGSAVYTVLWVWGHQVPKTFLGNQQCHPNRSDHPSTRMTSDCRRQPQEMDRCNCLSPVNRKGLREAELLDDENTPWKFEADKIKWLVNLNHLPPFPFWFLEV